MMKDVNEALDRHTESGRLIPQKGQAANPAVRGVTASWLAEVFDMDVRVVKARLRDCPVKSSHSRGTKMLTTHYDVKVAAAYLVTPAFSTAEYLRGVRRGDLPAALQQTVWDALLKRQKWEEAAGQLWRTEKIRDVLGLTFQSMKFTIQLWSETIERQTELSDTQRDLIVTLADGLQSDLYNALVENVGKAATGSQLEELSDLVGEGESLPEMLSVVDTWEDEIEALI
jgi:hypothetical protein